MKSPTPESLDSLIGHTDVKWQRRDVLRVLAGVAGLPIINAAAGSQRKVGIIGGGMAGVSMAWLLDGQREVVLLEAQPALGGNIRSITVERADQKFVVDMGAQYFHPSLYPTYIKLLELLDLTNQVHSFPTTITLGKSGEPTPRFVSPLFPGRVWPVTSPWNWAGLHAFRIAFADAKNREEENADWDLTVEAWLQTLNLPREQWEGMVLPWVASLYSGNIDEARGFSARAAMIFAAKTLPANPTEPLLYYVLNPGLAEVLRRLVLRTSTVEVLCGSPALQVSRQFSGGFTIQSASGRTFVVDDLVFASSGPGTSELLRGLPNTGAQQTAVQGIGFHDAQLALHTDSAYVAATSDYWSFFNAQIEGNYCEASMWLANVLALAPPAVGSKLWKSWITHRSRPPVQILNLIRFRHMLPTPASLHAQNRLLELQGRGNIWFVGGFTRAYDSQESALVSAIDVARGLLAGP